MRKNHTLPKVFTTDEAYAAGVSRATLTRDIRVVTKSRGIKAIATATALELAPKVQSLTPAAVISHYTAAEIHQLRLPWSYLNDPSQRSSVYLLKTDGKRSVRRKSVVSRTSKTPHR